MWTDPTGLERQGEMIDQAEATRAPAGKGIATLYRTSDGRLHLELYVGGKTHERLVPTPEIGRELMAKFRGE